MRRAHERPGNRPRGPREAPRPRAALLTSALEMSPVSYTVQPTEPAAQNLHRSTGGPLTGSGDEGRANARSWLAKGSDVNVRIQLRWLAMTLGLAFGLASGLTGCTEGEPDDTTEGEPDSDPICDPFAAIEHELSLGSILAAGSHADGTIYVVDQPETDMYGFRVFRSANDRLEIQEISGSASGAGELGEEYMFDIYEGDQFWTLMVLIKDGATSMYYQVGVPDVPPDPQNPTGDPLTLLDDAVVEEMALAPDVEMPELDFAADVEGGKLLVIACDPPRGCPYEGRLFFGEPDAVLEREITEVGGWCGGSIVGFRVDEMEGHLSITGDGHVSLSVGETSLVVTERADVEGAVFHCDSTLAERAASFAPDEAEPPCPG